MAESLTSAVLSARDQGQVLESGGRELERALASVRAILGTFAVVLIIGLGLVRGHHLDRIATPLLLGGSVIAASLVTEVIWQRLDLSRRLAVRAMQLVELSWYVLLMAALASIVPRVAWVILIVPIVTASLRLSDRAVIVTWVGGGVAYFGLVTAELVPIAGPAQDVLERLGMLLAVAAASAILARWLKEGWRIQAALTDNAERRNGYLSTIETAARQMKQASPTGVLDLCLDAVVALGFDAGTVGLCHGGEVDFLTGRSAGDMAVVPVSTVSSLPAAGAVEVASWGRMTDRNVHSALVKVPGQELAFAGWSRSPIDDSLATSFSDLIETSMAAFTASRHYEQARYQASHDPLTGLLNRAALTRRLQEMAARPGWLMVMFIDLDHFKPVNDTYGHQVGDALLVEIASRLRSIASDRASIARYGGDEFVVIAEGAPREAAIELSQQVREALHTPFQIAGNTLRISGSIGLLSTEGPVSPADAIRHSDAAAYSAKTAGRNQVHVVRQETIPQHSSPTGSERPINKVGHSGRNHR